MDNGRITPGKGNIRQSEFIRHMQNLLDSATGGMCVLKGAGIGTILALYLDPLHFVQMQLWGAGSDDPDP